VSNELTKSSAPAAAAAAGSARLGWQYSNTEHHHLHWRRLLRLLVAVRRRLSDAVVRQFVPAAVRRRVLCDVVGEHQQCSQRVHLLFDQQTIQTRVRSAGVTTLLFQIVLRRPSSKLCLASMIGLAAFLAAAMIFVFAKLLVICSFFFLFYRRRC